MMMLGEILLDTSIISLALFVWAVVIKLTAPLGTASQPSDEASDAAAAAAKDDQSAEKAPDKAKVPSTAKKKAAGAALAADTAGSQQQQQQPPLPVADVKPRIVRTAAESPAASLASTDVGKSSLHSYNPLMDVEDSDLEEEQADNINSNNTVSISQEEEAETDAVAADGADGEHQAGHDDKRARAATTTEPPHSGGVSAPPPEDGGRRHAAADECDEDDYDEDEEVDEEEGAQRLVDLLHNVDSSQCGDSKDATPLSSTPGSPKQASGLSRRQKKNRKKIRKKLSQATPVLSRTSSEELKTDSLVVSSKNIVPCKQYVKLKQPDQEIYKMMNNYTLGQNQMRQLGFPMQSTLYPGMAYIYRDPELTSSEEVTSVLNATAEEFIPSSSFSGAKKPLTAVNSSPTIIHSVNTVLPPATGSSLSLANSSPDLLNGHRSGEGRGVEESGSSIISITSVEKSSLEERRCVRCSKSFYMLSCGQYYSKETCSYHWGKLRSDLQQFGDIYQTYQCCGAQEFRGEGCSTAKLHVWSGIPIQSGIFGPLEDFIKTRTMKGSSKENRFTVFGLDCEMCYTTVGLELTKVTVVGIDGRLVYESLVQPENEIVDYNTRFSGITARDLNTRSPKSLKEVQQHLSGFISSDSILIGHGLENDLRSLKLLHDRVIDTSIVFPHFYGLPYRRSLRSLARSYLKREIQGNVYGHDSYEDARASVELMLWKVRKDMEKEAANII